MSTNKLLLDVDRSIIENNLLIKNDSPQYGLASPNEELERLFPLPRTPEERSKVIQLTPGVCVKTRDASGTGKIFVNLCTSEDLPAPPDVSDDELALILDSEDTTKYRVPMCLGEPRNEPDKSGDLCKVFDVAVHPAALKRFSASELFRQFIITAALEGLHNKYDVEMKVQDVTILSKRKSIGTPRPQRIRAGTDKASIPLISEICPAQALDLRPRKRVPKYRIRGEPSAGVDMKCMVTEIMLPDVVSAAELDVDIGEDRIVACGRKSGYLLDVFLPHLVVQDAAKAQFNRDTRVLTLTLPVK
ncbi:hypothetical protein B566_EDAN007172 [Ephemera danica]|nr:hypothetical protein B566_EDAN007172 [Ephemera danica]